MITFMVGKGAVVPKAYPLETYFQDHMSLGKTEMKKVQVEHLMCCYKLRISIRD